MKYLILVGFVAVASARSPSKNDSSSPEVGVVGGKNITIEKAPYQVNILRDGEHYCSGSIISKVWLLTSISGCVNDRNSRYSIVAGTADLENGGSRHSIASIIHHEDYRIHDIPYNDIALIRVNEPFVFDKTRQSIPLIDANKKTPGGAMGTLTGWRQDGIEFMPILQTVSVSIVDKATCNEDYEDYNHVKISVGQICAGIDHKGAYDYNDDGSPLVVDKRLTGIFSWGEEPASPRFPGVYTEVSAYIEWIRKNTSPKNRGPSGSLFIRKTMVSEMSLQVQI